MKKSFSKTIAVLLAVLMVVCSLPMTVFAAGESRSNVQLQFGTYFASGADTHQTYVDENYSGFGDSGLNTAKLDYNKATGTITEASSGHTYGVGDFFTVSVLLENTSSLAASQVGIKYSDNIVPAAVGENQDGLTALLPATEVTSPTDGFAPNEAITDQSGNAIYNTASSTVGEISYIDADKNTMWANFAVQDGTDAVNLTAPKQVGVNTFTKTAVLATFGFKIVSEGAVTFSLADSKDVDSAYYVETIANGGKVEEYKTYTQTNYDGSTALDFMNNNENIESTKYTVKFVGADGTVISEAQYAEGATVTVPDLPATTHDDNNHYTYSWNITPSTVATANATYTVVKNSAAHTWDEGKVTKEPTTTEKGIKTYTCTFEGCGATRTEEIPAKQDTHDHVWSDWVYNNDATYDAVAGEKNGTETRKCTVAGCTKTETREVAGTGALRVATLNADFGGEISAMFGVKKTALDQFDSYSMVVYREDGKTDYITDKKDIKPNSTGATMFFYYGITPQSLGSVYRLRVCGERNGKKYYGPEYEYNIMDKYILKQICKASSSTAWRTLLVELVYYGDAAQYYANWNTNNLASARLEEYYDAKTNTYARDYKYLHDTSVLTDLVSHKNNAYTVIENPKAVYKSLTVVFGAGTILQYTMKDTYKFNENTRVKVQVGASEFEYTYTENPDAFSYNEAGCPVFQFKDLYTKYVRTPVLVTWYEGNEQISNTYQWSAETYAKGRKTTSNEYNITQQLMKFGTAARAYFNVV